LEAEREMEASARPPPKPSSALLYTVVPLTTGTGSTTTILPMVTRANGATGSGVRASPRGVSRVKSTTQMGRSGSSTMSLRSSASGAYHPDPAVSAPDFAWLDASERSAALAEGQRRQREVLEENEGLPEWIAQTASRASLALHSAEQQQLLHQRAASFTSLSGGGGGANLGDTMLSSTKNLKGASFLPAIVSPSASSSHNASAKRLNSRGQTASNSTLLPLRE
jgi:hypothetical protein